MSDQSNHSSLPGLLGLGITVAVGIASVAAYMSSRNQTEEPVRQMQRAQPFEGAGRRLSRTYNPRSSNSVLRYEMPCAMQTPEGIRITYVVETSQQCRDVADLIRRDCDTYRVLGFDCKKAADGNVALLQLATHSGRCVLIRLCQLVNLADELSKILADPQIIKVGIDARDDARRLANAGISVAGTLELRFVAEQIGVRTVGGLHEMAQDILHYSMGNVEAADNNWTADTLDERHRNNAAEGALAGVEIFKNLEARYLSEGGLFDERNMDTFLRQFESGIA